MVNTIKIKQQSTTIIKEDQSRNIVNPVNNTSPTNLTIFFIYFYSFLKNRYQKTIKAKNKVHPGSLNLPLPVLSKYPFAIPTCHLKVR